MAAGEAWGYFITLEFLVMMCADMLVMAMAAILPTVSVQATGTHLYLTLCNGAHSGAQSM